MWRLFAILSLVLSAMAIRVPVDDTKGDSSEETKDNTDTISEKQPTYYTSDEDSVDSYLVPPNPHKPEEFPPGVIAPATYLVPPTPNQHSEYYLPIEADAQSDWYPIQKKPAKEQAQRRAPYSHPIVIGDPQDQVKVKTDSEEETVHLAFKIPSRQLEPPLEDDPSSFAEDESAEIELPVVERKHSAKITKPSVDLQLPLEKVNRNFNAGNRDLPLHFQLLPAEPTLALHLTPPRPGPPATAPAVAPASGKYPTKLYPKKYNTFRPVPIPIAHFTDPNSGIPKAKPLKHFKPVGSTESDYYPLDEKKIYQLEQAEEKRRLKEEDILRQQQSLDAAVAQTYADTPEPQTSESNFRHPGRNSYPAPLRQAPPRAPAADAQGPPPPGERTEFRMHGMKGPHSYQFGYDTGKGKNRQFRFEERDNEGRVHGHYGYMDKDGKMRVVNYNADPESGFHAEAPEEKPT